MTFHNLLRFSKKEDFPARFSHRNVPNQEAGGRKVTEKPPKAEAKADAKAERDGEKWGISPCFTIYDNLWILMVV